MSFLEVYLYYEHRKIKLLFKSGEKMKGFWFIFFVLMISFEARAKEISFTQEDRERLVRLEATLKEFKDAVDKRFEQIDKRFEQIDKRFEQIDKRFEEFRNYVDKRFEQIDKRFEEFRNYVDKRFEEVNKRFEQMMTFLWILSAVFVGIVAVTIAFALWDRRTMLKPVEDKINQLISLLKEIAKTDEKVAEALRKFGFL